MHSHVCDKPAASKVKEFESIQGGKRLHAEVRDGCTSPPKSRLVSVVRLDRDCTPRSDKEVHSRTLRCVREVRLDRVSTAPRFVMEVQLRMSRRSRFTRFGRNCMPWSVIRPHMLRSRCSSLVKPERNCTPWSVIVVFGSPMK